MGGASARAEEYPGDEPDKRQQQHDAHPQRFAAWLGIAAHGARNCPQVGQQNQRACDTERAHGQSASGPVRALRPGR